MPDTAFKISVAPHHFKKPNGPAKRSNRRGTATVAFKVSGTIAQEDIAASAWNRTFNAVHRQFACPFAQVSPFLLYFSLPFLSGKKEEQLRAEAQRSQRKDKMPLFT